MDEMDANMLQEEIAKLEEDISQKKAELAEVQAKLGGPTETGRPPVDEMNSSENGENNGADTEVGRLKAREAELISDITSEQMRLVALKRQLEQKNADSLMTSYGQED